MNFHFILRCDLCYHTISSFKSRNNSDCRQLQYYQASLNEYNQKMIKSWQISTKKKSQSLLMSLDIDRRLDWRLLDRRILSHDHINLKNVEEIWNYERVRLTGEKSKAMSEFQVNPKIRRLLSYYLLVG